MKKMKELYLLIITSVIIIAMCGCLSNRNHNEAETMKNMALNYLNEKYEDNFTALGYSDDWAYDYATVNFSSQKYSGTVGVRIYEEGGVYTFKDDYFKLTMNEEAEKYFKAIASKYGYAVETKVRFISLGDSEIDANAFFDDYVESGKCNMEVYFICRTFFSKRDIKAVLTDICNARIMGNIRFVVTSDSDLLTQYNISEIVNNNADSIIEKQSFSINSNFEVVE